MAAEPIIELGPWQLAWLLVPIAGVFAIAIATRLGNTGRLGVASVRSIVQLLAVGMVITWVFEARQWYWIAALWLAMVMIAGVTAASQIRNYRWWRHGLTMSALLGLVTGAMLVYLTEAVVRGDGWSARYLIPLGGMLLGNAMTASVLAAETYAADIKLRWADVEAMSALGATGRQAAAPSFRRAVITAMTPTVNAMMVVGVVKLPGMMTGQMLGGSPPFQAAMYQLVILVGIIACDTFAAVATAGLAVRQTFAARPHR